MTNHNFVDNSSILFISMAGCRYLKCKNKDRHNCFWSNSSVALVSGGPADVDIYSYIQLWHTYNIDSCDHVYCMVDGYGRNTVLLLDV